MSSLQHVTMLNGRNEKKIFVRLEKVRTFATAFERGRRESGSEARDI